MGSFAKLLTSLAVLAFAGAPQFVRAAAEPPQARVANPTRDFRKGVEDIHAGRLKQAEATALGLMAALPQDSSGRHLMGLVKTRKGDLAGAVAEFDKALEADPQSIDARTERAVLLARLGQLEKSRADLDALRARAAACAKACPPELKAAISRVEAALAAGGVRAPERPA